MGREITDPRPTLARASTALASCVIFTLDVLTHDPAGFALITRTNSAEFEHFWSFKQWSFGQTVSEVSCSSEVEIKFQYWCVHGQICPVFMKEFWQGRTGFGILAAMNAHTEVELSIQTAETVTVTWTGRAADRRPAAVLNPVFEQLLGRGRNLIFDLSRLDHMSSSTMVVIMKFVKQVNAAGVTIDFQYDESIAWQRMMFAPLRKLAAAAAIRRAA